MIDSKTLRSAEATTPKIILEELINKMGAEAVIAFIDDGERRITAGEYGSFLTDNETHSARLSMFQHEPGLHFSYESWGPFVLPLSEVGLVLQELGVADA
jgi:hypothetical protein